MNRVYLPAVVYIDEHEFWLLQFSNGEEGVVVDQERVLVRSSFSLLAKEAKSRRVSIDEADAIPIELDVVQSWLARPTLASIDPAIFLDAWDLFADITTSLNLEPWSTDPTNERVYEKLFWGSTNMAAESDSPGASVTWSGPEAVRLRQMMRRGLQLFRDLVLERRQTDMLDTTID